MPLPKKWDHEADVIVVGAGTAGLVAAIVVAEAKLKATVLESMTACGGSLNIIGGCMAFAGTEEQKKAGIDDSPEIFYQDLINIAGADPELARAYADNQLDAYRMLKEEGVEFPGLPPHPGHSRIRTHGWFAGLGPKVVKALENGARRRGVEILFKHRATRLITHPETGRVVGVQVVTDEQTKYFKAKKAVILATGGFGQNRETVEEFAPHMVDCPPIMPAGHRGDGLKMAMAIGAATRDVTNVTPSWPVCVETHTGAIWAVFQGGILVNKDGKRFYDESCKESYFGPLTGIAMRQPGGVYWIVYDEKIRTEVGKNCEAHLTHYLARCKDYKANIIEELAKAAGIDPHGLKETIEKYNKDIETVGYDTVFGRKTLLEPTFRAVKIENPPYYAIKCVTSTESFKGGLKINGRAQVINQFGEIIPGLYAAGEVTGGLFRKTYLLGGMTTSAMTLGIIAARNGIKEPSWQ